MRLDEQDVIPVGPDLENAPTRLEFSRALFRLLDEHKVRYCVLDSYDGLPERLASDLDLAVHPADLASLPLIYQKLAHRGYQPIQCLDYAVGAQYTVFGWLEGSVLALAAVDVICEHRRGGLILTPGEMLVASRRRLGEFWIPDRAMEFSYLLAKKTLKRSLPACQQELLKRLVTELGVQQAERIASDLFGQRRAREVIQACLTGTLGSFLPQLKRRAQWTHLTRHPWKSVRYWLGDALRLIRRLREPTGLFLAVLGPDGTGKSTMIDALQPQLAGAFRRCGRFHWRPAFLWKRKIIGPVTNPHGRPQHSQWGSIARLIAYLLDYWLGYWLAVWPLLVRSGLVVFDRYWDDLLADPRRYRFGGPPWLVRALGRMVPRPKLVLVLDAPEEVILSRKQEVEPEEVGRQRQIYLKLASESSQARIINTSQPVPETVESAARAVIHHLACRYQSHPPPLKRFRRRHGPAAPCSDRVLQQVVKRFVGEGYHGALLAKKGRAFTRSLTRPLLPQPRKDQSRKDGLRPRRLSYAVLPSENKPRWLLPLENTPTTLEGIRIYSPYRRMGSLAKALLAACIRTGWNGWVRDRIELRSPELLPIEVLVREVTGERQPVFALMLGASPRFSKLTIQVMQPQGEILGYIKLPLAQETTERVRHEAWVLKQLWNLPSLRPHLPRILYDGRWNDGHLLFLAPTEGRQGPATFTELHQSFLQTLSVACPREKSGDVLVEGVATQWHKVGASLGVAWGGLGDSILERTSRELHGRAIPCGITHGDFAPWNTRIAGHRLFVFDWESTAWENPILWDYFHFHVQVMSLLRPRFKSTGWLDGRSPVHRGLLLLYLLNSVSLLVEEGVNSEHRLIEGRKNLARLLLEKS
jgi:thymidylate kinase